MAYRAIAAARCGLPDDGHVRSPPPCQALFPRKRGARAVRSTFISIRRRNSASGGPRQSCSKRRARSARAPTTSTRSGPIPISAGGRRWCGMSRLSGGSARSPATSWRDRSSTRPTSWPRRACWPIRNGNGAGASSPSTPATERWSQGRWRRRSDRSLTVRARSGSATTCGSAKASSSAAGSR